MPPTLDLRISGPFISLCIQHSMEMLDGPGPAADFYASVTERRKGRNMPQGSVDWVVNTTLDCFDVAARHLKYLAYDTAVAAERKIIRSNCAYADRLAKKELRSAAFTPGFQYVQSRPLLPRDAFIGTDGPSASRVVPISRFVNHPNFRHGTLYPRRVHSPRHLSHLVVWSFTPEGSPPARDLALVAALDPSLRPGSTPPTSPG